MLLVTLAAALLTIGKVNPIREIGATWSGGINLDLSDSSVAASSSLQARQPLTGGGEKSQVISGEEEEPLFPPSVFRQNKVQHLLRLMRPAGKGRREDEVLI